MRWLDGIIDSMSMSLSKLWKTVKDGDVWPATVHGLQTVGHDLATEQQQMTTDAWKLNNIGNSYILAELQNRGKNLNWK